VDFARAHAGVTSLPRVGLNPYALGMRLFYYIEEIADKGKYSIEFKRLLDADKREKFDAETGQGPDFIFKIRENFSDFLFVNTFVDQDFVTRNKLFVAGRRLNKAKMVWEFYVKSRKVEDYRKMLLDTLYHPPYIEIDPEKGKNNTLYLVHRFEGKPLVKEFIANTMMGIEYLWGSPVQLETSEVVSTSPPKEETKEPEIKWQRVLYTIDNRKLSKKNI
jgi:stage V sporulation protein R